jgi:hypothetical protein
MIVPEVVEIIRKKFGWNYLKKGRRSSLELAIFFKVKPLAVINDFTIWVSCGAVENREEAEPW